MDKPVWLKPEAVTTCRGCGERQPVAVGAVGYRCRRCGTDWRWTTCGNCGALQTAPEESTAVECLECHAVHVAWWKTADSESVAAAVAERRRSEDARRRRAWRSWGLVLGLLVAAAVLAGFFWSLARR